MISLEKLVDWNAGLHLAEISHVASSAIPGSDPKDKHSNDNTICIAWLYRERFVHLGGTCRFSSIIQVIYPQPPTHYPNPLEQ